ncbi:MAG: pitrilysin family protein [Bacteroidales bacterium]|jgi:predicted Zn-dependent peptidase
MEYTKYVLDNGLRVIVNSDFSSPMVALNILYDIGARDEDPSLTGFAHLFEHLMFGGSSNIPDYDTPLQLAGGDNNAFTNNDYTDYHLTLPYQNLETGLWLESDRMNELAFSQESLNVQKKVVIEEYRQRYLNQPYGDAWLYLKPLAYKVHPYLWPTIGKEISHIEDARLSDVKDFFYSHYAPNNAILTLSGSIKSEEARNLVVKWFGSIPARTVKLRNLSAEPVQTEFRYLEITRPVPSPAVYLAWHMGDRFSREYYVLDLLSDILSNGMSSRLFLRLVKDQKLFSDIDAYISGDRDPGLFVISGRLANGITAESGIKAIREQIASLINDPISDRELDKVKNRAESQFLFSNMNVQSKALNLAYFEWMGDASMIDRELEVLRSVTIAEMKTTADQVFRESNCSCLVYLTNGEKE